MHGFPHRMCLTHLCVSTNGCWGMSLARMWAGTALIYFLPLCEGGHKVTNSKITAQVEQDDGLVPRFMQVTIWCCDSRESPLACPRGPWFLMPKALGQFVTSHRWLLVVEQYRKKTSCYLSWPAEKFHIQSNNQGEKYEEGMLYVLLFWCMSSDFCSEPAHSQDSAQPWLGQTVWFAVNRSQLCSSDLLKESSFRAKSPQLRPCVMRSVYRQFW